jgi:hypothetical protein
MCAMEREKSIIGEQHSVRCALFMPQVALVATGAKDGACPGVAYYRAFYLRRQSKNPLQNIQASFKVFKKSSFICLP